MEYIQLINPPTPELYIKGHRTGCYPPLNLVLLENSIKKISSNINIEILDGEILSMKDIISKLKKGIVGISTNAITYQSALQIAQQAKNKGSIVILGGPHASLYPQEILKNRLFIDYIIKGKGEKAIFELISNKDKHLIQNLCYRDKSIIINNKSDDSPIANNFPNYDSCNLSKYFYNFSKVNPNILTNRAFSIYSSEGCMWRNAIHGGCSFCSILNNKYKIKNPKSYWIEIQYHMNEYGANYFWDFSDTFTSNREWIHELVFLMPKKIDPAFQIYGRASDIDGDIVIKLKQIGITEIFIGLESGSDRILKNINKGISSFINLRASKILIENDIRLTLSFVLGLLGESESTLKETETLIYKILDMDSRIELHISIVMPFPGSSMYKLMIDKKILDKYNSVIDDIKLEDIRKSWINNFCRVDYNTLEFFQDKMLALSNKGGSLAKLITCSHKQE